MDRAALTSQVLERMAKLKDPNLQIVEQNGVKTRTLEVCQWRGEQIETRDVPCCGGKVRRQFLFKCSRPNGSGKAWSTECYSKYGPCRFSGTGGETSIIPRAVVMINTFNEGNDLRKTVESYRASSNADILVYADGTSDGSCDNLPEYVRLVRHKDSLGIGYCKNASITYLQEQMGFTDNDVIINADGHNRILQGDPVTHATGLMKRGAVVSAHHVSPLHCANMITTPIRRGLNKRTCKKCDWSPEVCNVNCPFIEDQRKSHNSMCGSRLGMDHGHLKVIAVRTNIPPTGVYGSAFSYSLGTMKAIGGWNTYPGRWGQQELGLSLRAWFAAVPVVAGMDFDVMHRFRSWNADVCRFPYPVQPYTVLANYLYCLRVVFDDKTYFDYWVPQVRQEHGFDVAVAMLDKSDVLARHEQYMGLKKRADAEFLEILNPRRAEQPARTRQVGPRAIPERQRRTNLPRTTQRAIPAPRVHPAPPNNVQGVVPEAGMHSFEPLLRQVICEIKPKRVLEWGPGRSTEIIASLCPDAEIISIEHEGEWLRKAQALCKNYKNITWMHLPIGKCTAYAIRPLAHGKFDLIFVDGRRRVECLLVASRVLNLGGRVLLHDSYRKQYQIGIDLFDKVIEADSTVVLRAKGDVPNASAATG